MCKCQKEIEKEMIREGFRNPRIERITSIEAGEFLDVPGITVFYTRNRKEHRTIVGCRYCPWCGEKLVKENLLPTKENFTFEENG